MPDLILAIGDWWAGIIGAVRGLWSRMSGAGTKSREAGGGVAVRRRTHGMRSRPKQEGDR